MWGLRLVDILAEVQSTCRRSSINVFVCVISLSLDSNCPKKLFRVTVSAGVRLGEKLYERHCIQLVRLFLKQS